MKMYIFLWPPCMNFLIFCGRKNAKIDFRNNVQVILLKFKKWPPQVDFLNICDRKISNLIYDGGWYRTSGLLLNILSKRQPEVNFMIFCGHKFDCHISHNMEMCRWFSKVLLKFGSTWKNFVGAKIKSEIIHTLQSHSPQYGDVHVIFSSFTEIQNGSTS